MFFMTNTLENSISFKSIKDSLIQKFNHSQETPLLDAMLEYKSSPMTGFHIPGHNRGLGVHPKLVELMGLDALSVDTTDEFDNLGTLHPATGAIEKAQELAASVFGRIPDAPSGSGDRLYSRGSGAAQAGRPARHPGANAARV